MKPALVLASFATGVCLVLLKPSLPAIRSVVSPPSQENCGCEEGAIKEDLPFANRMPAQAYADLYDAVQKMPGEKTGPSKLKKVAGITITDQGWESFGPQAVPQIGAASGNKSFGRIRRMLWYYNTGFGSWEAFLGAGSGGLYYGYNYSDWVSIGDLLSNPAIGAIAVDPFNPNTMFIGTGDWGRYNGVGLLKTTDRGLLWSAVITPQRPNVITQILYLVGSSFMIMSTDIGIYRSTDGGNSWALKVVDTTDQHASVYNLVAASASTLYAALPGKGAYNYGVYKSLDGGNTWFKSSNGLPSTSGATIAIDVSKSNPEILYASYTNASDNLAGVYLTTDGGVSWNPTAAPPNYITGGQGFHVNVIRVHPGFPGTVYAAGVSMVKSIDYGGHWMELGREARGHDDITSIEFDPNDPNHVYICSDGGIILRDELFGTLDNANYIFEPGAPLQIYEMDDSWSESNVMAAGLQDNGTLVTADASTPAGLWYEFAGCDGANHLSIDPYNSSLFYFNEWCDANGLDPRFRTDNGGQASVTIDGSLPVKTFAPVRLSKGGPTPLWTVTNSTLYYSYNRGNSWNSAVFFGASFTNWPGRLSANFNAPLSNKVCYVTGPNGHVFVAWGTPGSMLMDDYTYKLANNMTNAVADRWNPDVGYALKTGRIFRTSDKGQTWTEITGNLKPLTTMQFNDIISSPTDPKALYLSSWMGMWKTLDGGNKWFKFQIGLPLVNVTRLSIIPGVDYDTLRIATYGRGFWHRLIRDIDQNSMVQFPISGNTLSLHGNGNGAIALGSVGGSFKSTDGGSTWDTLDPGTPNNLNSSGSLGPIIIAGGDLGTIVRSTDGGTTWALTPPPTAADVTGISITPSGIPWACADDGMLMKSTDAGQTWMTQTTFPGVALRSCQFLDDSYGYLLGRSTAGTELVYRTTNGGDLWTPFTLPTTGFLSKLCFTADSEGFAVGDSEAIFKTTDGAATWSMVDTGSNHSLYDCYFMDQLTGWSCGDSGTILKTEDGGDTWNDISNPSLGRLRSVSMSDTRLLFAGDGGIFSSNLSHENNTFYSLNNNWNMVSLAEGVADSSVHTLFPTALSHAYSYNGTGYVIATSLAPTRGYWLKFNGDQVVSVTGTPSGGLSIPVTRGWNLIGSSSVHVQTRNISSSPPGIVTSQFFAYNGAYVIATTIEPGKAYWVKVGQDGTLTLPSSGAASAAPSARIKIVANSELPPPPPDAGASPLLPAEFALKQNFPNPFNPNTVISYELPRDAKVSLTIYDLLGREVTRLVDGVQDAGTKFITWNAANYATGVYLYRLDAVARDGSQRFVSVRKMVCIK